MARKGMRLITIEEVAEKTYRLETPVPELQTVFSVYLVHTEKAVLIDPGPTAAVPSILDGMKQLGVHRVSYIIPTHIHLDHAGATGRLAQLFPLAKVVLHPLGVKHIVDPSRLVQSTRMAFGDDFELRYGPILPVPESQVRVATDAEVISAGGRGIQVFYAPGHAPHHLAIFDRKTGGLFCGESLGVPRHGAESSPLPSVAPPSFDMEVYLATMEKLRGLGPRILLYSHDGVGKEPDRLIIRAEENTRAFGNLILEALRAQESPEAIERRVQEYAAMRFGLEAEALGVKMMVSGYTLYFKKMGLI